MCVCVCVCVRARVCFNVGIMFRFSCAATDGLAEHLLSLYPTFCRFNPLLGVQPSLALGLALLSPLPVE